MERIRVSKVEGVYLLRRGTRFDGTLHLMPHHIVFSYLPSLPADAPADAKPPRQKEVWITYPMINHCSLKPCPPILRQESSIRIRCRDFTFFAFFFPDEKKARDVYDSIRALSCKIGRLDKLLAFTYQPKPPEDQQDGWNIYDARREWKRLGISPKDTEKGWRISEINVEYKVHNLRQIQIKACLDEWNSTQRHTPPCSSCPPMSRTASFDMPAIDGTGNAGRTTVDDLTGSAETDPDLPKIYGAQQRNLIVDARPTINAYAMQAVGLGSEKMDYYPGAEKAYLGIDNIHVMRKSLDTVIEALKESDLISFPPNRQLLAKSNWIKHIANILDGTALIARTVGIMHSHVLIHCSDGWDRTSQLSALSQILLDPYYRTLEGFIVLVEKDWLSFGHMFRHRSGFLSHEKWFTVENEKIERKDGQGGGNAFDNAIRGARGLFNRHNESNESLNQLPESNGDNVTDIADITAPKPEKIGAAEEHRVTKVNELSPVFHQFLDCVYQLHYQHPTRFEFSERFLRRLLYHLYSCQYGTFLFDNEKERVDSRAKERTRSVWDYFLCRKQEFMNPKYDPETDDTIRGKERIIFPRKGEARWWAECFGRTDEEMNVFGPQAPPSLTPQTSIASNGKSGTTTPIPEEPIVTGIETADGAIGAGTTVNLPPTHAIGDRSPKVSSTPKPFDAAAALGQDLRQGVMASFEKLGITASSSRAVSPAAESNRASADVAREAVKPSSQLSPDIDQKPQQAPKPEDVKIAQPEDDSIDMNADKSAEQVLETEAAQNTDLGLGSNIVEKKAENRTRSRKPSHNPEEKKDVVEMEMQ
ncbi:protein phosphatase family protein [Pyrenophora tritici-repentis Pt-1C-BFP]|uniref:Protein phosphatase family protein n=1 Tax=Pyrenophora tritici-repentis (strain Pt-1C-BFP) TaxID=426418 RepID=B2VR86_PYRTR|nr:protein phosphatase family protein [Pyrenophora tritici-repentis Pt-1C-BFP]EDU39461.1 protein phosphatase family protein [Pyrenophora tritici-repentis Pt-1C-BFP]